MVSALIYASAAALQLLSLFGGSSAKFILTIPNASKPGFMPLIDSSNTRISPRKVPVEIFAPSFRNRTVLVKFQPIFSDMVEIVPNTISVRLNKDGKNTVQLNLIAAPNLLEEMFNQTLQLKAYARGVVLPPRLPGFINCTDSKHNTTLVNGFLQRSFAAAKKCILSNSKTTLFHEGSSRNKPQDDYPAAPGAYRVFDSQFTKVQVLFEGCARNPRTNCVTKVAVSHQQKSRIIEIDNRLQNLCNAGRNILRYEPTTTGSSLIITEDNRGVVTVSIGKTLRLSITPVQSDSRGWEMNLALTVSGSFSTAAAPTICRERGGQGLPPMQQLTGTSSYFVCLASKICAEAVKTPEFPRDELPAGAKECLPADDKLDQQRRPTVSPDCVIVSRSLVIIPVPGMPITSENLATELPVYCDKIFSRFTSDQIRGDVNTANTECKGWTPSEHGQTGTTLEERVQGLLNDLYAKAADLVKTLRADINPGVQGKAGILVKEFSLQVKDCPA